MPQPISRLLKRQGIPHQPMELSGRGWLDRKRASCDLETASATHPYVGLRDTPTTDPLKPLLRCFFFFFLLQSPLPAADSFCCIILVRESASPPLLSGSRVCASAPRTTAAESPSSLLPKAPKPPRCSEESRGLEVDSVIVERLQQILPADNCLPLVDALHAVCASPKNQRERQLRELPGLLRDIEALAVSPDI